MKTIQEISQSLNHIRSIIDTDIVEVDIDQQQNKLLMLTQIIGLSAECKASSKKILHLKELDVLSELNLTDMQPSIIGKMLTAKTAHEIALLEYSDRINSAVIHSIDAIRSIISLYKTELENSLKS